MYLTSQSFTQVATIFGPGYVPEQRGDETHCQLPWGEKREPLVNFDELLAQHCHFDSGLRIPPIQSPGGGTPWSRKES